LGLPAWPAERMREAATGIMIMQHNRRAGAGPAGSR